VCCSQIRRKVIKILCPVSFWVTQKHSEPPFNIRYSEGNICLRGVMLVNFYPFFLQPWANREKFLLNVCLNLYCKETNDKHLCLQLKVHWENRTQRLCT
jgi:hypothetical protein